MLSEKLNKIFAKRGGELFAFVFSLLLAFFMWSMYRLTLRYSTIFEYRVELSSNIEGRAHSSISYNSLVLRGKSSGFFILQQRYDQKRERYALPVSVDSKYLKPVEGNDDLFYIESGSLQADVQKVLGNDLQLESIISDTLFFIYPKQANKKVPVVGLSEITYEGQYTSLGKMIFRPDSVVVYGNEQIIDGVESVSTHFITKKLASSPVQGLVGLRPIKGVRFSDEKIYYSLDVVRYFEGSVKVKPSVINLPQGVRMVTIPQEVELFYRMAFDNKREVTASDFNVVIDYNGYTGGTTIKPYVERVPKEVFETRLEPKFIECVIN